MIHIEITPAVNGNGGIYLATGHAGPGKENVCTAVTAIEECLAANLENTWNIRWRRTAIKGSYELNWNKTDRRGRGLQRANMAAGFAYNGLKALAASYPEDVRVRWCPKNIERREQK